MTNGLGKRARGFTLIELMITLAVIGILMRLAAPSFSTWIRNQQVRTVSDALQNGLRTAQAEAVRLNRQVVFSLTNQVPGDSSTAVANGSYWAMHAVPLIAGDTLSFLQGGPLADAGGAATITGPASICFSSAGRQITNATPGVNGANCTAAATAYTVSRPGAVAGIDRSLRVTVSLGGQIRACDPNRTGAADGC